jgi:hypothetical protein
MGVIITIILLKIYKLNIVGKVTYNLLLWFGYVAIKPVQYDKTICYKFMYGVVCTSGNI